MPKKRDSRAVTGERARAHEILAPLLKALYDEIQELSKKKPDTTLNGSKVALANRLLVDIRELLQGEPEAKYLDLLDDATLPQYSDVVIILSQYVTAMSRFRDRHYNSMLGAWIIE